MENILAFGDSILKGIVLNNGKYKVSQNRFPNLFEAAYPVTVTNKGKFGSTVVEGVNLIKRNEHLIESFEGRFVVLKFGGNDCDFKWSEVSDNPGGNHSSKVSLSEFHRIYRDIIIKIMALGKVPVLMSLPLGNIKRYLNWISRDLNMDNIYDWLQIGPDFLTNWHEVYNFEIYKIASELDVSVIDITTPFLMRKNCAEYFCDDGIHPNDMGHKVIANAINRHVTDKLITFL